MSRRNNTPDPLDEDDPRVLVEWTDKLGQKVHPGDYVATKNYSALSIGKVLLISALRKDGKPFTSATPQMTLHLCNLGDMKLGFWRKGFDWNPTTYQYDRYEEVPLLYTERYPFANTIKVDWKPENER